jgi:hypothetical protein
MFMYEICDPLSVLESAIYGLDSPMTYIDPLGEGFAFLAMQTDSTILYSSLLFTLTHLPLLSAPLPPS